MGIGSSIDLSYLGFFVLGFLCIFALLLREIQKLNEALDDSKKSKMRLHEKMSEKLSDIEIEKIHLENKISQLEETISLWQSKSRQLNNHVNILTNSGHEPSKDDEITREIISLAYRSAA